MLPSLEPTGRDNSQQPLQTNKNPIWKQQSHTTNVMEIPLSNQLLAVMVSQVIAGCLALWYFYLLNLKLWATFLENLCAKISEMKFFARPPFYFSVWFGIINISKTMKPTYGRWWPEVHAVVDLWFLESYFQYRRLSAALNLNRIWDWQRIIYIDWNWIMHS